jgi:hypothetical protein
MNILVICDGRKPQIGMLDDKSSSRGVSPPQSKSHIDPSAVLKMKIPFYHSSFILFLHSLPSFSSFILFLHSLPSFSSFILFLHSLPSFFINLSYHSHKVFVEGNIPRRRTEEGAQRFALS